MLEDVGDDVEAPVIFGLIHKEIAVALWRRVTSWQL
jgi:hypothetical protein